MDNECNNIKYSDYKAKCNAIDEECYIEYLGTIVDIRGMFNIYERLSKESEAFNFDLVHSVVKVDVALDTERDLLEVTGGYVMCGLEISNDAISDLRKAFKHWNDKYGLTYYVPTETVVDIKDEIEGMINESTEYVYSI